MWRYRTGLGAAGRTGERRLRSWSSRALSRRYHNHASVSKANPMTCESFIDELDSGDRDVRRDGLAPRANFRSRSVSVPSGRRRSKDQAWRIASRLEPERRADKRVRMTTETQSRAGKVRWRSRSVTAEMRISIPMNLILESLSKARRGRALNKGLPRPARPRKEQPQQAERNTRRRRSPVGDHHQGKDHRKVDEEGERTARPHAS